MRCSIDGLCFGFIDAHSNTEFHPPSCVLLLLLLLRRCSCCRARRCFCCATLIIFNIINKLLIIIWFLVIIICTVVHDLRVNLTWEHFFSRYPSVALARRNTVHKHINDMDHAIIINNVDTRSKC